MDTAKKEEVLAKFGYSEKVEGDTIKLFKSNGRLAATIANGKIKENYTGRKSECGSVAQEELANVYGVSRR